MIYSPSLSSPPPRPFLHNLATSKSVRFCEGRQFLEKDGEEKSSKNQENDRFRNGSAAIFRVGPFIQISSGNGQEGTLLE